HCSYRRLHVVRSVFYYCQPDSPDRHSFPTRRSSDLERLVKQLTNVRDQIYVATSDYAEQRTIFGSGALRKSARELYIELEVMQQTIEERMETQKKEKPTSKIILDEHVLKI